LKSYKILNLLFPQVLHIRVNHPSNHWFLCISG